MGPILLHQRQAANRIAHLAGIRPNATYHSHLGPGDEIAALIVTEAGPRQLCGCVLSVVEHGWYADVRVQNGQPVPETIRLFRDGPPEWGAIECRLTRLAHRPLRKPLLSAVVAD